MSLRSQFEQRKIPFMLAISFIALAVSTAVTLIAIPAFELVTPPTVSEASIFAANTQASARSTIYIFALRFATSSSIGAIEINAPTGYDLQNADYIRGLDRFGASSFVVTDSKMEISFDEPARIPAGSAITIEIGGINNPSSPGQYSFEILVIGSDASVVDAGSASITIVGMTILPNSIGSEHLQDGSVSAEKIADNSVSLDKLAADVFFFLDDRISSLQNEISDQIDSLGAELKELIQSEESSRITADENESTARAVEDEDIRKEIDELRQQLEDLEEEVDGLNNAN